MMKKREVNGCCCRCWNVHGQDRFALLCDSTGAQIPEFVPSGGGYNAAVGTAMKGDVDFACCGFGESIELVKGGQLNSLAYWGMESYTLPNGNVYP